MTTFPKPKKRKVRPTEKQRRAFQHLNNATSMRQAMLAAGYDDTTALNAKANLIDTPGFRTLIEEYRGHLRESGINPNILAEIQAEGLFSEDDKVRLDYIKETKKDFGIFQPDSRPNINIGIGFKKSDFEY